jgi:hypothetical protein
MRSIMKNLVITVLLAIGPQIALANSALDGLVDKYLSDPTGADELCLEEFSRLPETSCLALIEAAARSITGGSIDKRALKETLSADFSSPEFLNSSLNSVFGKVPIGLEFKALDSNDGESVLGLGYAIQKSFLKLDESPSEDWHRSVVANFDASGTITNESEKNPRNFLDTKISAAYTWSTRIPIQSDDFGLELTNSWQEAASVCVQKGANSDECKAAKRRGLDLFDSTGQYLNAFQRYHAGFDMGYETDQSFDAKQSKFGAYVFGQYEAWGNTGVLGQLGLTPAFRLAVDRINPNDETPRAIAGDDSSYYRYSGELSVWMPVGTYLGQRLAFTANLRHWGEISPSDVVEDAGLDDFSLATVTLSSPVGIFVSYSSGELPFDRKSDDVVELGWKTYF